MNKYFSVGWLYAWRWLAAMILGAFEGWSIGTLFSGLVPFIPSIVNIIFGATLIVAFSVLYYLERKAGVTTSG